MCNAHYLPNCTAVKLQLTVSKIAAVLTHDSEVLITLCDTTTMKPEHLPA